MSLAKKKLLLGAIPVVAAGGAGAWWMLLGKFIGNKEVNGPANVSLSQKKNTGPKLASTLRTKSEAPRITELRKEPEVPIVTHEPQPEERVPDEEEQEDLPTAEYSVQIKTKEEELQEQMSSVGLDCGDASKEIDCATGERTELDFDLGEGKKGTYVPHGDDNGTFKLRISESLISGKTFSFTITKKPIKLQNKDDSDEIITLEKYEHYGLVKGEGDKVYLTRTLTAEEGMIKDLGLPDKCSKKITSDAFDYKNPNPLCELWTSQIKRVNFEGKKDEGATSEGNLRLYIQKVKDTVTYKDGYKFFIQGYKEVNISEKSKLAADVWWDFRIKETDEGNLLLERVWEDEKELLSQIGLSCEDDGICTINDDSLKIKVGNSFIDNGKKKSDSKGTVYLEKNKPGHYEGLRFSVWGGEIEIEGSDSPIKMKELEIYHITKEDSPTSSYYLTRKHGVEEMIRVLLGLSTQSPPVPGQTIGYSGLVSHLRRIKFYDKEGEKQITIDDKQDPKASLTISSNPKYPFGYKFSINPSVEKQAGSITLKAGVNTDFRIKKDVDNKKLYLEEDK